MKPYVTLYRTYKLGKHFQIFFSCALFAAIVYSLSGESETTQANFTFKMPKTWFSTEDKKPSSYVTTNREVFCNKCDFESIKIFFKHDFCHKKALTPMSVYIVGGNKGQLTKDVLQVCENIEMTVFEPHPELSQDLMDMKLKSDFDQAVTVKRFGISDKNEVLNFYGNKKQRHGLSGFHNKANYGLELLGKVPVVPLKTLVKHKVDYIVVDVEGHEIEVITGMDLAKNAELFPVIQVELGGTWIDPDRSNMKMTQSEFVHYLSDFGYSVFLMGQLEEDKSGVLLPINDVIIRQACTHKGSNGLCYVQGNLVAVHPEFVRKDLWPIIQKNVDASIKKLNKKHPFSYFKY